MRNSELRCNQSSRLGFLPVAGREKVFLLEYGNMVVS